MKSLRLLAGFALIVLLVVVVRPLVCEQVAAERPAARQRPNILVILTDDQRYRAGYEDMPVTMRRFRTEGTEFTQAVSTTPLCCPSRSSIFTGEYTHNHGVWGNDPTEPPPLVPGEPPRRTTELDQRITMQAALQRSGYRTAIFGKYLNDWDLQRPPPYFDQWAIFADSAISYRDGLWQVDGTERAVPGYYATYLGDRATGFIEANQSKPWFLEVSTAGPHKPYLPDLPYLHTPVAPFHGNPAVGETDKRDKPRYIRHDEDGFPKAQRIHDRQIRTLYSIDDMVQRIFSALDQTRQTQNTLAFFLSDNGFMWGEHGFIGKRPPYLQSIRIPFFVRWPGHVAPGVTDSRLVGPLDIAPTVFDATGITANHVMDGHSLLSPYARSSILIEYGSESTVPTWAGILTRRHEFVQDYGAEGRVTFREDYDRVHDPWELRNLLRDGDRADDPNVAELARRLAADRICAGASCP